MMRFTLLIALLVPSTVLAHDTWVQTNTNLVRDGDVVHIDLMLGNHGNEHRDFKIAGKLGLEGSSLAVIDPDGKHYDIKGGLADTGYAPKEGFWTTRFEPAKPGLYTVAHQSDSVMSYARRGRSKEPRRSSSYPRASTGRPTTIPVSTSRWVTTWRSFRSPIRSRQWGRGARSESA